jgi:histone-lysine N-methyltransferase SUV39H
VVNNGIHVRLEVFKTIKCGWGVRTLQNIPAHTFIAEYSGEILSHDEAESRKDVAGGDSYFLDTETLDELRQGSSSNIEYVLDAKLFGNVSRFFNGSCSPNMIKEKGR